MPRRLSEKAKEKIQKLYTKGISMIDIAWQIGVSYSSIYGLTRARQRTNPETGKPFESRAEYDKYNARQRTKRNKNKELSDLISKQLKRLGQTQSWLAEQLGVSKQAVSLYSQGKSLPKSERLDQLLKIINPNSSRKPKSLDDY